MRLYGLRLFQLLDNTNVEGWKKIQCWEDENNPTIYCEGYDLSYAETRICRNRRVSHIYPYTNGTNESCLCIELEKE